MSTFLMQWNIRGLRANYASGLQPLIHTHNPQIICLQETKLSNTYDINKYKSYHHINNNNLIAAGGSSIFVRSNLLQRHIPLTTDLQAVAVRITSHQPVTICSIYLPPGVIPTLKQLTDLQDQLPKPLLIVGDFNAHSPLWCSGDTTDRRGKLIEDLLTKSDTFLLNNEDSPTYQNPKDLKLSSLDLSLCTPSLAPSLNWSALEDTHGSDHFPILLESNIPTKSPPPLQYNFKKANWTNHSEECKTRLNQNITDKTAEHFSEELLDISDRNIPKLSTLPRKNKSWFNDDCSRAVAHKRAMLRRAKSNNTFENFNNFKRAQAKCRQVCREAKRSSFRKYISKINNRTPMSKIWKIVNKLKGTHKDSINHIVKEDGSVAETEKEVANEIADSLSKNCSSENYNENFKKFKSTKEKEKLDFSTKLNEIYNSKFTLSELKSCIADLSHTAPGPDKIHNTILAHLPEESILLLLDIFNNIWTQKIFPHSWRQATIVPIPKPGKDHTNPSNYRPIALTSCLCKLMEKLVNKRLMWFLETNKKISKFQSGFRKNRSTLDQLVRLETFIRNAFLKGEHVTVVFFDIEKAFDTTWKTGILRDLHKMGLRGNLPIFIENFLQNRTFQTRVGTEYSDWHPQEQGVPQGSILSPILFEIKINSIIETLSTDTDGSLYVDDFIMAYKSKGKIDASERHLQQQLRKLEKWADTNGYRFSTSKTSVVHFCRQHKCIKKPELYIYGKKIEVKDEAKFLGVIFDRKLSFLPHIKDLKRRCLQALNAFKVFCSPEWGGDTEILLQLYGSLVRSRLDYACQVYGSARPSYLKMLDPIQNQGLRLAMGAYRTSPETSLHVEAHVLPLGLRRRQLTLQYAEKISSTPDNPVYKCIFKTPEDIETLCDLKGSAIKPIGLRIARDLEELSFNYKDTEPFRFPSTPFWALRPVEVDLELTSLPKSSTPPETYYKSYQLL